MLTTISTFFPLMRLAAKFNQTGAASFDVPKWAVKARLPRHVRKSSRKLRRVPSSQITDWFDLTRMMKGMSWLCKKSNQSNPMNSRSATHSIIVLSLTYILEYLPAYSPDYNPIEHTWAQAKAHRRKTGETAEQISPIKSESKVESSGYR